MTIEALQAICNALPAVTESIKWEHDLVFSVGEKMFCVVGLDQSPATASFKVHAETFEEMCSQPGRKPAPYLARHHWVLVEDITMIQPKEWEQILHNAYALVKEKLTPKAKRKAGLL